MSLPKHFGAWSAYFGVDLSSYPSPSFFYEVQPPLGVEPRYKPLMSFYSGSARCLELWWDGELVRIILACETPAAVQPLRQAYPGAAFLDVQPPSWTELQGGKNHGFTFDVELSHSLPWVWTAPGQEGLLIDRVISALSGGYPPAWVQFAWMRWDWTWLAEEAAIRWQSHVEQVEAGEVRVDEEALAESFARSMMGHIVSPVPRLKRERSVNAAGTVYQLGAKIAQMYREKAHSTPLILHIRGAVAAELPGDVKLLADALASAFESVDFQLDALMVIVYHDRRALEWMERRALPDPTPFLELHAQGGFLCDWGEGRELVPTLCVTPQELPAFIHLPADPSLPVRYTRAAGVPFAFQPPEEEGLELWR